MKNQGSPTLEKSTFARGTVYNYVNGNPANAKMTNYDNNGGDHIQL